MPYNKTNWQNEPSTATPLNAANLNKLETQYDAVVADIGDTGTELGAQLSEVINAKFLPTPQNAWQHWGDSMTSDTAFSGYWTDKFEAANSFEAPSFNIAQPGETAAQILTRVTNQGGSVRSRRFTIGAGRNGFKTTDPWVIVNQIRLMLVQFTAQPWGFVFDIPPFTDDTNSDRERRVALNAALAFAFPNLYLPIWSYLRTQEAAQAAEIAFTNTDLEDIAAGNTPASFRTDAGHINDFGGKAVAYFLQKYSYYRAYVSAPPVLPAPVGPNLVPNGTFETDINGWVGQGGAPAALTRSTSESHSGVASLRIQYASDSVSRAALFPSISVAPNKALTTKFWVKGPAGTIMRSRMTTYTSANAALANIDSAAFTLTGNWQQVTASGVVGATGASADWKLEKSGASATSTPVVFLDDVEIYQPA